MNYTLPIEKYHYIFWDWNGTLLNDAWLNVDIMNNLLKIYRLPTHTVEQYRKIFDFPVSLYYQRLGFDFKVVPFEKVGLEFIREYEQRQVECLLQEGAYEFLAKVASLGLTQVILSAAHINMLEKQTTQYGIRPYFKHIIGADNNLGTSKLTIAQTYIHENPLDPQATLLIGDTTHDHAVAQALGIDCILLSSGYQSYERLADYPVPLFSSLKDCFSAFCN